MGDRKDLIKFGPEWLRNLSRECNSDVSTSNATSRPTSSAATNSRTTRTLAFIRNSSTVPHTSSATLATTTSSVNAAGAGAVATSSAASANQASKVQLAKLRYGREEMLALFDTSTVQPPSELKHNDILYLAGCKAPFALQETFEDTETVPRENAKPSGSGNTDERISRGRGVMRPSVGANDRGRLRQPNRPGVGRGRALQLLKRLQTTALEETPNSQRSWGNAASTNLNRLPNEPSEWYKSKRQGNNSTNWRQVHRDEGGDEWRASDLGRSRSNNNLDRDWGDRHRRTWASGEPQSVHDELPEWFDNPDAGAGTFDASGAFHGVSNDDTSLPKSQETAHPLTRSHTHGSFERFERSRNYEENAEDWWASEKAQKLSPKKFETSDKFRQQTAAMPEANMAMRRSESHGSLEELPLKTEQRPGSSASNTNAAFKPQFERKAFNPLGRTDLEQTSGQAGNFQSVMITSNTNNSLRQKHQNLVPPSEQQKSEESTVDEMLHFPLERHVPTVTTMVTCTMTSTVAGITNAQGPTSFKDLMEMSKRRSYMVPQSTRLINPLETLRRANNEQKAKATLPPNQTRGMSPIILLNPEELGANILARTANAKAPVAPNSARPMAPIGMHNPDLNTIASGNALGSSALGKAAMVNAPVVPNLVEVMPPLRIPNSDVNNIAAGNALGGSALGNAALGSSAMGSVAMGSAAIGSSAMGSAAMGSSAMGSAAMGNSALGTAAMGSAAMGSSAMGSATMGSSVMGSAAMSNSALGSGAMGNAAMGSSSMPLVGNAVLGSAGMNNAVLGNSMTKTGLGSVRMGNATGNNIGLANTGITNEAMPLSVMPGAGMSAFQNSSMQGMSGSGMSNMDAPYLRRAAINLRLANEMQMQNQGNQANLYPMQGLQHPSNPNSYDALYRNMLQRMQPVSTSSTALSDHQWYYEDPKKNIQGPFSSAEMFYWYSAGFFNSAMLVRRTCDTEMRPLGSYGPMPFNALTYAVNSGFDDLPQVPRDSLLNNPSRMSLDMMPNLPVNSVDSMQYGSVDMRNPSFGQQPMVESLWGQPNSADLVWRQQNVQPEISADQLLPNDLALEFWDKTTGIMLPEEIAKEMKTEDQILAQLRANQMNTNPNTPFPANQPVVPPTGNNTKSTTDISLTSSLGDLNKIIKLDSPPQTPPPIINELEKSKILPVSESQPTVDASVSDENNAKDPVVPSKTCEVSKPTDKPSKSRENNNTTKSKSKKSKEEKKEETVVETKVKEDENNQVERQVEVPQMPKAVQKEKSSKKDLEKDNKLWAKDTFALVKGVDKGSNKDLRKKAEEAKVAEEAERKRKEEEKLAAEEEKKRKQAEVLRKQQDLQQRELQQRASESVAKKAPWSFASQAMQATSNYGPTLAEIQKLEREKKLEQMKEQQQMMQIIAQHQAAALAREQEMQANLGWAKKKAANANASAASLPEIQAETRRKTANDSSPAFPMPQEEIQQPTTTTSNAAPWGNNPNGDGFWDSPPVASKGEKKSEKRVVEPTKTVKKKSNTTVAKKEPSAAAEFELWCNTSLSMWSSKIDVPTFVNFLKDIESPYEVKDYVKCYLGETKDANDFARQFLERRSKLLRVGMATPSDDLCSPAAAVNPRPSTTSDYQEVKVKGKRGKKNKMLKVDARILGFSVTAAEDRINVGDIDMA